MKDDNPIIDILCAPEEPPTWLVEDLWLQGGFYTLVGESGAGKSYVSYTLALAMAAGVRALSGIIKKAEPRCVVYFDDENSEQDRNKYLRRAWLGLKALNGGKEPSLKLLQQNFWPCSYELGNENWPEIVSAWVKAKEPHALYFDTANACFGIEDENNNAEAGRAIKQVKQVMRESDPTSTAVVIKHAKTRTESGQIRTVRGAKIWKDQSDGVLFQIKAGGRPRKDGLSLTRLIPDKVRAYGLQRPIYITPDWTDDARTGLVLQGSYSSSSDHKRAEKRDEADDE